MLCFVLEGKTSQSVPVDEKSFIHCCCENGSLLSNQIGGASMKVVDVTTERDFTNKSAVHDITWKLKGPGDVLFSVLELYRVVYFRSVLYNLEELRKAVSVQLCSRLYSCVHFCTIVYVRRVFVQPLSNCIEMFVKCCKSDKKVVMFLKIV